jgi:hypothetical protein
MNRRSADGTRAEGESCEASDSNRSPGRRVPALLSAQAVSFDSPEATCLLAPYFAGSGGFVGEPARMDDADTTGVDESEVNSSAVTRPTGSAADVEVTVTLMGTKFITTGTVAATANLNDLHSSVLGVALSSASGAAPGANEAGVLNWTVTVGADANRCASTNPDRLTAQTVPVGVAAVDEVIPGLSANGVETSFTVNCAAASAAGRGVELVPGNPFPVD